ncbi:uncharacterized protein si:ch1073-126c3.2 [Chanos chanos]|uniref:Uncharacterized protein si:ch1073-126c3.2 n=1 Tax=Chanos chanos TaxID=29144 RepID=A0A6J2V3N5_CHACN|nr:uncharacterized protein LOC115809398 [Chanos chanos]
MMAGTISTAVIWLCVAFVFFTSEIQGSTNDTCSSAGWSFEQLSAKLKGAEECLEVLAGQWADNQTASILDSLRRLTDILQKQQKTVCKDAPPAECPAPVAQSKGGLVCVSTEEKRYCKPMCNEGYDFSFLRRSRIYEECSRANKHKWTTHYVGGNKLAVCNKSNVQISGAASAYFPKDQDCLRTKSDIQLETQVIETFLQELRESGMTGPYSHACLICG